jgi:hypothetical protein
MTNKWIGKATTAALFAGCVAVAAAQSNGPLGISPRIGFFESTSSRVKGTYFAIGLDYKLNSLSASVPGSGLIGYWGVSIDYYDRGATSNLPIVINYNLRQGPIVYALGAGVEFYDLDNLNGSTGTGFDGQASITYDIKTPVVPIFLQAKYFLASHEENRGFGIYAGVRF